MLNLFIQTPLLASEEEAEKQVLRTSNFLPEQEMSVEQEVKVKLKPYILDAEQTIARFFPPKTSWQKKLSSTEYFFSSFFTNGGLTFKGEVSIDRFLDAMQGALQDFDFLFSHFHRNQEDLHASYSIEDGDNHFIQLEIEKRQETINTTTLAFILPEKIDERMRGLATNQFEGLPMGAFKLTTLIDGFAIGYYLNHAFFDQSSVVYFLKYLSHLYSYGSNNLILKKPDIADLDLLDTNQSPDFKDITEIRAYGESLLGFKYTPIETNNFALPSHPDSILTVDLKFRLKEIDKLKNLAGQYLSTNDIIHAVLLKIYSFNPELPLSEDFCLRFVCNMRKACGLGEESMGNVLGQGRLSLKIEGIRNATILELALANRQRVSEINVEGFKDTLIWYRYIKKEYESPINYMSNLDLLSCMVTNWSTFNYDNIIFDDAIPVELKTPYYGDREHVIAFDNKDSEKTLRTSICVPLKGLDSLLELENATNLFSAEKRS